MREGVSMGNAGFIESIRRANSNIRYWAYRRSIGNPFPFRVVPRQWVRRFLYEWIGRGKYET